MRHSGALSLQLRMMLSAARDESSSIFICTSHQNRRLIWRLWLKTCDDEGIHIKGSFRTDFTDKVSVTFVVAKDLRGQTLTEIAVDQYPGIPFG